MSRESKQEKEALGEASSTCTLQSKGSGELKWEGRLVSHLSKARRTAKRFVSRAFRGLASYRRCARASLGGQRAELRRKGARKEAEEQLPRREEGDSPSSLSPACSLCELRARNGDSVSGTNARRSQRSISSRERPQDASPRASLLRPRRAHQAERNHLGASLALRTLRTFYRQLGRGAFPRLADEAES